MDDMLMQKLHRARKPEEKAAIIAEAFIASLPSEIAHVARQCVLFHWFDQSIVAALLEDRQVTEQYYMYRQLISLPFIEEVLGGLAFQDVTRNGLLQHYSQTNPTLLKTAARLAIPAYKRHRDEPRAGGEAFFCAIVAGQQEEAANVFHHVVNQFISQEDWQRVEALFRLQDEAERGLLPFVQPLLRGKEELTLRVSFTKRQNSINLL